MSNQPPMFNGRCRGGPLDCQMLASGSPRRTFSKPVDPKIVSIESDISDLIPMKVAGYYDWSYTEHGWVWTDA